MNSSSMIENHYARGDIFVRIMDALSKAGVGLDNLRAQDFYFFDQLHSRGIEATREHGIRARLTPNLRVLDLGCGVGGSARYLAIEQKCQVMGIDLTWEYIAVARELTALCDLSDLVTYEQANALDLPFEDNTFDHVWSHNMTMNVEDKLGFASEAARVLKSGGQFTLAELSKGMDGPLTYPLPWARDASSNFLITAREMRDVLSNSGLRIVEWFDDTQVYLKHSRKALERFQGNKRPALGPFLVLGDDLPVRVQNVLRARTDGLIIDQFVVMEKP